LGYQFISLDPWQRAHVSLSANDNLVISQRTGSRPVRGDNSSRHRRSISEYTRSIEIDPRLIDACYDRSVSHERRGDRDRAIPDYRMALQIDPVFEPSRKALSNLSQTP
jgi:tetratricopeptide (TPR) repeat protein